MGNGTSRPSTSRRIYVGKMGEMEDKEVKDTIDAYKNGRPMPNKLKTAGKIGTTPAYANNSVKSSKYTFWSFVPKILFFQMKRLLNFYYLCVIGYQLTLYFFGWGSSEEEIISNALPFTFVHILTALKEAYEDCARHKTDFLANNRLVYIIKRGGEVAIKSKDLTVGTIVKIQRLEHFPADILIIGSSDTISRFQISTANVDGESLIKMKYCPLGLPNLNSPQLLSKFTGLIECDGPNTNLRLFNGFIIVPTKNLNTLKREANGETGGDSESLSDSKYTIIPCTVENMAFRGSTLRNTAVVYGIVIYTGKETRVGMNAKKSRKKFSTVERSINLMLVALISIVICLVAGCTVMNFFFLKFLRDERILHDDNAWYFGPSEPHKFVKHVAVLIGDFWFMFNHLIPINIYIYIDLIQMFGSKFFSWDKAMQCPETGEPAVINTSEICEELGQIQYLFTDKTGTITENKFQLRHCSIEGQRYTLKDGDIFCHINDITGEEEEVDAASQEQIIKFLRVIALCHTVHLVPFRKLPHVGGEIKPEKVSAKMKATTSLEEMNISNRRKNSMEEYLGDFEYEASSQDEKALVQTCARLGVTFLGEHGEENEKVILLDVNGTRETYKKHFLLEFESARRCMSVLVEDQNGDIWLLSKGDEFTVFKKATSGNIDDTRRHVKEYGALGMRTFGIAKKQINRAGLLSFTKQLLAAREIEDDKARDDKIHDLYRKIESNLHVVGATGVEDHIQEHVAETVEILANAGIRVWILTGDNVVTAVNVAIGCHFIKPGWKILYGTEYSSDAEVLSIWKKLAAPIPRGQQAVYIIDGQTFDIGLRICPDLVRRLILTADRIIGCRMTPLQKALVVRMVKEGPKRPITAAVGDGANDVAMIHEAHVGIGIFGMEGRQAARSADFAIGRFSFLRRAILVHGHWYYVRLANMTNYSFYKNIVFTLPNFYFCIDNGFSGQALYNTLFYSLYNILFMALPIFFYGYLDQVYRAKILLQYPYIYTQVSRNHLLSCKTVFFWYLSAIYHSGVIYYIPKYAWLLSLSSKICNLASFGALIFSGVFAVVNMRIFMIIRYLPVLTIFALLLTYLIFPAVFFIISELDLPTLIGDEFFRSTYRGVYLTIIVLYEFWLVLMLVIVVSLIPDFCIAAFHSYCSLYDEENEVVYTLPTRTLHPVEPGTGDDMKTATMHATIGYADDAADPVEANPHA